MSIMYMFDLNMAITMKLLGSSVKVYVLAFDLE